MRYGLSAAVAVALMASATAAKADSAIGLLECRGASQQYIVGSMTHLQCLFRPSYGGRPQPYLGSIRRVGVDLGFNQSTHLAWSVFAPGPPGPGGLSGVYYGPSANATIGVGLGANVLWGGSDRTVALQPVSGQSQIGLGVVGGVSAMELQAAGGPMRYHRRHRHRR